MCSICSFLITPSRISTGLLSERSITVDGTFDLETNILHKVFNIKSPNGHIESREISQRMYTPRDLEVMLTQAGFIIDELYGDWDGNPISSSSEKIIVIVHK